MNFNLIFNRFYFDFWLIWMRRKWMSRTILEQRPRRPLFIGICLLCVATLLVAFVSISSFAACPLLLLLLLLLFLLSQCWVAFCERGHTDICLASIINKYDSFLDASEHCRKLKCMKFIKPSDALNEHIRIGILLCACKMRRRTKPNVCLCASKQIKYVIRATRFNPKHVRAPMNLFATHFDCYRCAERSPATFARLNQF